MKNYLLIGFLSFILSFSFLVTTPKVFANGFYPEFDICDILPFLCEEEEEDQITICHRTESEENPWVEITVDENAVETHLEHGDFLVDEEYVCPPEDEEEEPTPTPTEEPEQEITPTSTPEVVAEQPVASGGGTGEVSNNPPVCNGVYATAPAWGAGERVDSDTVRFNWTVPTDQHDSQFIIYGDSPDNLIFSVQNIPAYASTWEVNGIYWQTHTFYKVGLWRGSCTSFSNTFDP